LKNLSGSEQRALLFRGSVYDREEPFIYELTKEIDIARADPIKHKTFLF